MREAAAGQDDAASCIDANQASLPFDHRAAHHAVLDISDDDSAVVSAFRGIAFDEIVIHEAVKAIMPALPIESQKVIAE